tara:strand:- start:15 stop:332 length:318 start_codon:yes stop_codon:yes gene_type:complete
MNYKSSPVGLFELNYGSDLVFKIPWPDGDGGVIDLTDWTVNVIDITEAISGLITATKDNDPTTGNVNVRLEWSPDLDKHTPYDFRIQLTKGGDDVSTNLLRLIYR